MKCRKATSVCWKNCLTPSNATDTRSVISPPVLAIRSHATEITAYYKLDILTVRFYDPDGELVETKEVPYNHEITPPSTADFDECYYFNGWSKMSTAPSFNQSMSTQTLRPLKTLCCFTTSPKW